LDPTLKTRIISNLKDQMHSYSPQMRTAAKYIIDQQADFGLDSIRVTARKASLSTYTFVNIAKRLNFSGFEDLRKPFRYALVASPSSLQKTEWLDDIRKDDELGNVYSDAAQNALSIVRRSLERQSVKQLDEIVEMLISANKVYLTAVRSSYSIAYYLHYVGRIALPSLQLIPRHMNSAIDDLNDANPGDVLIAITITPYSRETVSACEYAKKKGVKLLIISDSEVVSHQFSSDHTLVASVLSTHNFGCFSGMMSVVELLVAMLMYRGGSEALERIKSYENIRIENNAYWVAQKKH